MELLSFEDKTLLIVEVYPSGSRPHWLRKEGTEEGIYVKLSSMNRKADRELIAELKRGAQELAAYDEVLNNKALGFIEIDLNDGVKVNYAK